MLSRIPSILVVAYDLCGHQGMTPWRWRSQLPCASSPSTSKDEGCRLPLHCVGTSSRHGTSHLGLACLWTYLPYFVIMSFLSSHVFKRAFAYFPFSLLGLWVSYSLFGTLFVKPFFFVNFFISMSIFRLRVVGFKWALSPLGPFWAL